MATNSNATLTQETPHVTKSTENERIDRNDSDEKPISSVLRRRAESVIKDTSIDAESRALVRYGLEINDPSLAELVRRVDAGETIDTIDFSKLSNNSEDDSGEERILALAEMICRVGDEPEIKSAALLVLMAMLENAQHPKALANTVKNLAFMHCAELNVAGMVDAQITLLEGELLR
ncbi:MAG TPA: hypothetical protein VF088_11925 [Pyrinomonadaceae bacterium]